jgi:integrase
MHPWDAGQLAAFLAWSREHSELHAAWHVLAYTGMRRGELLALRWRDIDLYAATITLRRSAGLIRVKAEGAKVEKGPAKTGKPRVIDLDPAPWASCAPGRRTGEGWRSCSPAMTRWCSVTSGAAFATRAFQRDLGPDRQAGCPRRRGRVRDPAARPAPHPRHDPASERPRARHVVSARLGHASSVVTMTVYAHVLPGSHHEAATRFAELVKMARCPEVSKTSITSPSGLRLQGCDLGKLGVGGRSRTNCTSVRP